MNRNNGPLRTYIDYRVTTKNKCTFPQIEDLLVQLYGAFWFSNIDLRIDLHQLGVMEKNILHTTVHFSYGSCEILVMAFGLTNASYRFDESIFQVIPR